MPCNLKELSEMEDPVGKKLADLEIRFTEQEKTVQELSDIVSKQWDLIDRLTRRLENTHDRLSVLEEDMPANSAVEKPPHY